MEQTNGLYIGVYAELKNGTKVFILDYHRERYYVEYWEKAKGYNFHLKIKKWVAKSKIKKYLV